MGYRSYKKPKPIPHRNVQDIATPSKLYVTNGTKATFAFPCWYMEIEPPIPAKMHRQDIHDHRGWPSPGHPDASCQLWIPEHGEMPSRIKPECWPFPTRYLDHEKVSPIHLLSEYEGYSTFDVAWVDGQPDGISMNAYVNQDEDWVVRLDVNCQDPSSLSEENRYKFTVFANAPAHNNLPARRDVVVLSELVVLPSAY